ncbi:ISPsy24, transposase orfA [Pseudomonas cannabina pv. alisalensis]|uniref:Transposase n=1 Tax=Pseudomonas cannabina TaxID=86840 RepID=A0AB37Q7X1_PSECA|nr:ISPsy24, transposase orfA [Pseudomonas cannabina pv. alisalensis]RMN78447.1 hypothetical protein ALQ53_200134 [Pseudomonas cannabina]
MTKQRRTFSAEFKREAVGYSHIEASRSLGVVESALRRWVRQLQQERNSVTPQILLPHAYGKIRIPALRKVPIYCPTCRFCTIKSGQALATASHSQTLIHRSQP